MEAVLDRREDLAGNPPAVASELARKFALDASEEFELRVLVNPIPEDEHTEQAGLPTDGPTREAPLDSTSKAIPKPPPRPPSMSSRMRKSDPLGPAPAQEAGRAVIGIPLSEHIRVAHQSPETHDLRELVIRVANAAAAVGNAHRSGRVVRNLSTENLLYGEAGEVVYTDPNRLPDAAYFSPERARDPDGAHPPTSDVFALGVILFEALTGRPLFAQGAKEATLKAVLDDERREIESAFQLPEPVVTVYERATAPDPALRPPDGTSVAVELDRWLHGIELTTPPLHRVASHPMRITQLRELAERTRVEAATLLAKVPEDGSIDDKQAAWKKQDDAAQHDRDAEQLEREYRAALERALAIEPRDNEARKLLGELLHRQHKRAEQAGDDASAIGARLREVAGERYAKYLDGKGRLTISTEPEGATVELYRYVLKDRRLWPELVGDLGRTPIADHTLEMGSYVAILKHPDCADVRYPVLIRRRTHWHGRGPGGGDTPAPVKLPARKDMDPEEECYVPSSWFLCGGPEEANAMPRTWTWCEGFIIQKHPVWMHAYLAFLDSLEAAGHPGLNECIPRTPDGRPMAVSKKRNHTIAPDVDWSPYWPVTGVTWKAATAYADWFAGKTGRPWRLANDLEWEKAARGVDGRTYPWGNGLDPMFANYAMSHAGRPTPVDKKSFPSDSSPYGVRGMAGNVRDWCRDPFQSRARIESGRPPIVTSDGPKVVRGGHYEMTGPGLVSWMRSKVDAKTVSPLIGFRLVRRFPG